MVELSDEIVLRNRVLLAFQVALLGAVSPNLRGVSVTWTDSHIQGVFVYDGEVSENESQIVSDVEGEVISFFVSHTIELVAKSAPVPADLNQFFLEAWVYVRLE